MVSLKALCALLIFKLPPPIQEQLTEQYIFLGGEGGGEESKREEAECLVLHVEVSSY